MIITNLSKNIVIAGDAHIANTFFSRLKGLLGRASLKNSEALVITRCQSIHMLFMRFAIDAIFVSKEMAVVGLVKNIKPFQLSRIFFLASCVVECPIGTIDKTKTELGDKLIWD